MYDVLKGNRSNRIKTACFFFLLFFFQAVNWLIWYGSTVDTRMFCQDDKHYGSSSVP